MATRTNKNRDAILQRAFDETYDRAENDYVRQGSNMTREQAQWRIKAPKVAMVTNPISEYNNRHFVTVRDPRTGNWVRPVHYFGNQARMNATKRTRNRSMLQRQVNDVTGVNEFSKKSAERRAERMYDAVKTFYDEGLLQGNSRSTGNSGSENNRQ